MSSDRIDLRLDELRRELQQGQEEMAKLERKRGDLRDTMLRITGAIQVLEELAGKPDQEKRPS